MLLKELAYYKTGGKADHIKTPSSTAEVALILKKLHQEGGRYFFLGSGSNSLVMDEAYGGSVISFHKLNHLQVEGDKILVGAGCLNTDLAKAAYDHGLAGLSWLYRLPGQLGATTRMNARCYGGEISEVVVSVEVVTREGEVVVYKNEGIFKGYKDTSFMTSGEAITQVTFQAHKGDPKEIWQKMQACEKDRLSKNQFDYPSCGCVFKNHHEIGVPSGMLLQAAGAKKMSTKTLLVNPHHANFVFNKGATSREILELTLKMRDAVYEEFGVFMAYEMEMLGDVPQDLKDQLAAQKPHKLKRDKLAPLIEAFASRKASK